MHLRSISPLGADISMPSVERLAPKRGWLNEDEAFPVCPEPCTPLRGGERRLGQGIKVHGDVQTLEDQVIFPGCPLEDDASSLNSALRHKARTISSDAYISYGLRSKCDSSLFPGYIVMSRSLRWRTPAMPINVILSVQMYFFE
ncbi:uncharacterized protein LOC144074281 isoform X2 [Stigmatopora argus]